MKELPAFLDTETGQNEKFLDLWVSTGMRQIERATQLQIWAILKEKAIFQTSEEARGRSPKLIRQ